MRVAIAATFFLGCAGAPPAVPASSGQPSSTLRRPIEDETVNIPSASAIAKNESPGEAAEVARMPAQHNAAPLVLATPPFGYVLRRAIATGSSPPPALQKLEEKRNKITDDADWFRALGLSLPTWEVPNSFRKLAGNLPADIPVTYQNERIVLAIDRKDHAVLVYGEDFSKGRYLVVVDAQHHPIASFDFEAFLVPPKVATSFGPYTHAAVTWAVVQDKVLYVSTSHHTYASASVGKNAFLSAIDLETGELLWQSDPLVANTHNFLVRGDYILSGYGFTAEPDFLYVLSRGTGKVVKKIPVKSGPDFLLERDGKLYVRTYDTNYVFSL